MKADEAALCPAPPEDSPSAGLAWNDIPMREETEFDYMLIVEHLQ